MAAAALGLNRRAGTTLRLEFSDGRFHQMLLHIRYACRLLSRSRLKARPVQARQRGG